MSLLWINNINNSNWNLPISAWNMIFISIDTVSRYMNLTNWYLKTFLQFGYCLIRREGPRYLITHSPPPQSPTLLFFSSSFITRILNEILLFFLWKKIAVINHDFRLKFQITMGKNFLVTFDRKYVLDCISTHLHFMDKWIFDSIVLLCQAIRLSPSDI